MEALINDLNEVQMSRDTEPALSSCVHILPACVMKGLFALLVPS